MRVTTTQCVPIRHGRECSEKKPCCLPNFVPSASAVTQLSATLCFVLPVEPNSRDGGKKAACTCILCLSGAMKNRMLKGKADVLNHIYVTQYILISEVLNATPLHCLDCSVGHILQYIFQARIKVGTVSAAVWFSWPS